jgi:hypothetical protein
MPFNSKSLIHKKYFIYNNFHSNCSFINQLLQFLPILVILLHRFPSEMSKSGANKRVRKSGLDELLDTEASPQAQVGELFAVETFMKNGHCHSTDQNFNLNFYFFAGNAAPHFSKSRRSAAAAADPPCSAAWRWAQLAVGPARAHCCFWPCVYTGPSGKIGKSVREIK